MYTPEYILKFVRRVDHVHNFSSWAALRFSMQHSAVSSTVSSLRFEIIWSFWTRQEVFICRSPGAQSIFLDSRFFFFAYDRVYTVILSPRYVRRFEFLSAMLKAARSAQPGVCFFGHPKFSGVAFVLCFVGRAYAMTWCHPVILHTWYVHTPGIFFMFVKFCLLCFRSYDYCVKLLFVPGTWYTISYHMSSWRTNATSTTYIWYVLYVPRKYIPVPIVHMETNNISIRYPTLVPAGKGVDRRKWMTPLVRTCNRNRSCGDRWILFFGGRSARMISQVFYARPFFIPGIYIPGI